MLSNKENNTQFWINNPKILLNNKYITEVSFNNNMTLEQKLNALTRFIILVSIVGFILIRHFSILLLGIFFILIVVLYHSYLKTEDKENFSLIGLLDLNKKEAINKTNPLMNPLTSDFNTKFKQNEALDNEKYNNEINDIAKNTIIDINENNKDNNKLFNDLESNLNFETSMRQFYSIPGSSVPNGQEKFLDFCYGNLTSEKNISVY